MADTNFRKHAVSGIKSTILSQIVKFICQGLSLVVLSRILDTSAFGSYAIIAAIASFGFLVADFGLSFAIVQARTVTHQQKTNLFWLNSLLGLSVSALMVVGAPLLATLYSDPDLVTGIILIAPAPLLLSVAAQSKANLTRELKFGTLALADVISQVSGITVAIFLALGDYGIYALVWQNLVIALTLTSIYVATDRWVPSLPKRNADMQALLNFGANTFAGNLLNTLSASADKLFLGYSTTTISLGGYSRVQQLFVIPVTQLLSPLTRVFVPLLSKQRDNLEHYNRLVQKIYLPLVLSVATAFGLMASLSEPIVLLLLGESFARFSPLLLIFSIGGFFQGAGYIYYWIFLSSGKMDIQFRLGLIPRLASMPLIVWGALNGVYWAAAAYSFMLFSNWFIYSAIGMKKCGVKTKPLLTLVPIALSAQVVPFLICYFALERLEPISHLILGTVTYLVLALVGFLSFPSIRFALIDQLKITRKAI